MVQIRITEISGGTYPIQVILSDIYGNNATNLGTIDPGPVPPVETYNSIIPSIFQTAPEVMVRLIDSNGCEIFKNILCNTPSPTPTNTPTPTITPSSQTPTVTPTNTPTPTITPSSQTPTPTPTATITPSITPTNTPTPSPLPFMAYLFPEPQDSTSLNNLGQYMSDAGAISFFGWGNSNTPAGVNYSSDMAIYAQYSGWTGSVGNFVTNVSLLSGEIRQSSGAGLDTYGCPQNQYAFGSIMVDSSLVNPAIEYTYTVWVPLAGVGGVMNNMTMDVGYGSACSTSVIDNGVPDFTNAGVNVTVPSGCAIPAGIYRILWMNELFSQPSTTPLSTTFWVKGDTKS